jgi:hypothetical protein
MERGVMGNYHAPCGAGEKLEITSNAYLLQTRVEVPAAILAAFLLVLKWQVSCRGYKIMDGEI